MRTRVRAMVQMAVVLALAAPALAGAGRLTRLPPDREMRVSSADSPGAVVFSHAAHLDQGRPDCTACHPRLFPIERAAAPGWRVRVTHHEMDARRQCGACHDGRTAFGRDDCSACHRAQ